MINKENNLHKKSYNDDFRSTIRARLDIRAEMIMNEATGTKIDNFNISILIIFQ